MKIDIQRFYLIGGILMGFSFVGALVNTKIQWIALNIGGKMNMLASSFFQLLLCVFFLGLYYQGYKQTKTINSPELGKFLDNLKSDDETLKEMKGGNEENDKNRIIENEYIA